MPVPKSVGDHWQTDFINTQDILRDLDHEKCDLKQAKWIALNSDQTLGEMILCDQIAAIIPKRLVENKPETLSDAPEITEGFLKASCRAISSVRHRWLETIPECENLGLIVTQNAAQAYRELIQYRINNPNYPDTERELSTLTTWLQSESCSMQNSTVKSVTLKGHRLILAH